MKTKVSIVKCRTYNPGEVQAGVSKAFDLLGGISSFIKKGEKVLVKPNMLSGRPPEHGVNTHVEIIRAVVRLIKHCGASPAIGDNPGGSLSAREAYETSGMSAIAREEAVACAESKNARVVKGIPIASYFFEFDKIISVPKMKTHSLTCITGAIKNMFGAVAGLHKSACHKRFPMPQDFAGVLADVLEVVRPQLVLMDGVIAMDGDGPAAGRLRNAGLLIGGQDSVAVDSVFSHLIGIDPFDISATKEAYKRKLGEALLENIEIIGETIEDSFIKDFRLPRLKLRINIPKPILRILASQVKFGPRINKRHCVKCKICAESCPVSAITINDTESRINQRLCIRCMCCHEVCPYRAVELKTNILARVFGL